jgi:hypothetical protein
MGAHVHLGQNNDKEVHALNVAVTNFGQFIVNLMHLL